MTASQRLAARGLGLFFSSSVLVAPQWTGRKAFHVFCTLRRRSLAQRHRDVLEPARAFTLTDHGDLLQGYRWGHGPRRVLLIHGWESHTGFWRPLLPLLDPEVFTVHALDAPGHGLSEGTYLNVARYSEVLTALLDHLGPQDAIVAHSVGAFALGKALHERPELPVGSFAALAATAQVAQFLDYYQSLLRFTPRVYRAMEDATLHVTGKPVAYFHLPTYGKAFRMPGLILHDPADPEAPFANAQALHANWPQSELVPFPGAGHNLRQPEVWQRVLEFLSHQQSTRIQPTIADAVSSARR